MFPFNLWHHAVLGDYVLLALGVLLFGFALAWGLRNDLQSWPTTVLYYGWIILGLFSWVIPPVLLQVFVLTGLWLVSLMRPWNSLAWLRWGFLLWVLSWGGCGYWCYQRVEENYASLREQYPLVSLAERLPRPAMSSSADALSSEAKETTLADLEKEVGENENSRRARYLQAVHAHTLYEFIEREGRGFERAMPMLTFEFDRRGREGPFEQSESSWTNEEEGDLWNPRKAEEISALGAAHRQNIVNFAFPRGFGFVKDRSHVAGFESHRFQGPLKSDESWKIVHIELVSLLLHIPPIVYQSDELPRMDRVKQVSTRLLDPFENAALARIKKGEDLIVADVPRGLRMLGAIRNAKQCIQCHEGKRGDLLGAFAYSIQTTGNPP